MISMRRLKWHTIVNYQKKNATKKNEKQEWFGQSQTSKLKFNL